MSALPLNVRWLLDPGHCLALGFGAGLAPRAPGTFGTLAGLPLALALLWLPWPWQAVCLAGLFLLGVWVCGRTARALGVPDHGAIVWDEIVGIGIALAGLPLDWRLALAGFLLFRLLDILKPWPIGWLDRRVHGGFGIMLDDALAGAVTALLLHAGAPLLR